jgi:hypothetical protein
MTSIDNSFAPETEKPRKRKRIFMWTFIAIQVIFLIWVISGAASAGQDVNNYCNPTGDQTCHDAYTVGASAGFLMVMVVWAITDFILGIGRLIVVLSRRH